MIRKVAWQILRSGVPSPLREVDRRLKMGEFDPRDAGLLRRLVGIETRHRGTLRAVVRHLARRKPKPELGAHLHLGLAQILFFDRIPDHAAVSETLLAVNRTIGQSKVRVVNGILREALRNCSVGTTGDPRRDFPGRDLHWSGPLFRDPEEHPFLWAEDALSIPSHLMKRWSKRYGWDKACELGTYFLAEPPLVVRAVARSRDEVRSELEALELEFRDAAHAGSFVLDPASTHALTSCDAFREGRITIQGESASSAAELLGVEANETVLDLCAAPGGKTSVLAGTGARVVASDSGFERLGLLGSTLERLRLLEDVSVVCAQGARAFRPSSFDAALIDAPCSNTGVLGARPGARWRFGPKSLASLAELQSTLLEEGARAVRPGGRLVWSTCSLEPEENAQRVRAFLEAHSTWTLEEERESLPGPDGPIDGGYAARLRRGS